MEKIAKARAGACDPMPRELASQLTVRRQPGSRCDERGGDASSGAETCMYLATVALASHRSAAARKGAKQTGRAACTHLVGRPAEAADP